MNPVFIEPARVAKIRALNDTLRTTFTGGRIMLTSGVAALDADTKAAVLMAIRGYSSFDESSDPHCEHDMCFVEVHGERYWAKVDYYDADMRYLSDDPSNPQVTRRIMTIGHASEY